MNDNGPPLVFSLLGVIFGVGVAWVITRESAMALTFLVVGSILVVALHLRRKGRRPPRPRL